MMEVRRPKGVYHDMDLSQEKAAFGREVSRLRSLKTFKQPGRAAKMIMDTALDTGDLTEEGYRRLKAEIDSGEDPEEVFVARKLILASYRGYVEEMEARIENVYALAN